MNGNWSSVFTWNAWFTYNAASNDWGVLIGKHTTWGDHKGWVLHAWGGANTTISFTRAWTFSSGGSLTASLGDVNDYNSGWHMVTATSDGSGNGSGMKVYLDGNYRGAASGSSTTDVTNTVNLTIGGGDNTNNMKGWNGYIDEVPMWSREWDAQEIRKWYTWSKGKYL